MTSSISRPSDFGSSSNRSVNLHFRTEQSSGYQVLYKEGGTDSGMSIYLDGNQLWMGVWSQPQETFVQLGSVQSRAVVWRHCSLRDG